MEKFIERMKAPHWNLTPANLAILEEVNQLSKEHGFPAIYPGASRKYDCDDIDFSCRFEVPRDPWNDFSDGPRNDHPRYVKLKLRLHVREEDKDRNLLRHDAIAYDGSGWESMINCRVITKYSPEELKKFFSVSLPEYIAEMNRRSRSECPWELDWNQ